MLAVTPRHQTFSGQFLQMSEHNWLLSEPVCLMKCAFPDNISVHFLNVTLEHCSVSSLEPIYTAYTRIYTAYTHMYV